MVEGEAVVREDAKERALLAEGIAREDLGGRKKKTKDRQAQRQRRRRTNGRARATSGGESRRDGAAVDPG